MFVYADFKMYLINGDFQKAKAMLSDAGIDTESFAVLSNAAMFLSLLFRYPDDDVYDTLKDNWEPFNSFYTEYRPDFPSLYDQTAMQSDFIKLFKQDFHGSKVVPYISYYTEDNKMLYGQCTFKIREWMAEEGFFLDKSAADLEDNVYIVLEFLSAVFAHLSEPENIERWYSSFRNLFRILDSYGRVLSDEFAKLTAARADMPFYASCGVLLSGFLNDLDEILEDILTAG